MTCVSDSHFKTSMPFYLLNISTSLNIYISLTGMQYFGNTKVKYHYSTFNHNPDIRQGTSER